MEGGNVEVGVIEKVLEQVPKLFELAGVCIEAVLANPILLMYFSVGLIGVGLSIFAMMKRTARR